jgi:ATP-dependent DNA helicase RecQ
MQYKAGYFLESVWKELKKISKDKVDDLKLKGLLENLTTFDALTTLNLNRPAEINSLLAVANNIITRGTPTLCSVFVEEEIANLIKRTEKNIEYGTIKFPFINSDYSTENFFNALHFILPKTEATSEQLFTGDLDSNFEKNFINSLIPSEHSYLKQLFQHQRKRKTLNETVYRGSVDFCLEVPYFINTPVKPNRFRENVTIKGKKNFIVEIDGAAYHTDTIDDLRDFQINDMLNTVSRITELNLGNDVTKLIGLLKDEDFIKVVSKNFNSNVDTTLNTLLFSPICIARIQKVLIEFLICNYDLLKTGNKPLTIAIIEQDVPCAALAINDLTQLFEKLVALENKNSWLPKFELTVVSSKTFENSPLKAIDTLQSLPISEHTKFDLVIDVSVFKREGIFNSDFVDSPNKITIRSSHFTMKETMNTVCSANLIHYREVAKAINNEEHEIDEEAESILKYFVQYIFRKENFREGQLPILNRALSCKPVIGLLPTGGGKSLTYQLSALLQPGITLVVDPIRSLMKDQFDGLLEIGIDKCDFINSTLSTSQRTFIQKHELPFGQKQFIFLSPERFVIEDFRIAINTTISNKNYFAYCVIDEVHCVSEWGHDFRVPYLNLGINAQDICKTKTGDKVVLFGLTATASFDVLTDIERELQIGKTDGNAVVRYENTLRDELNYQIIETEVFLKDKTGKSEPIKEHWQISDSSWKKYVGGFKQQRIENSIIKGEEKITKFNTEPVLRELLETTFNQYLPRSQRENYINKFNGKDSPEKLASDFFVSEMLPKLFIEWKPILQKNGDAFNYGIIIFCPHKNGALGVKDVASNLEMKLPTEIIGTFVGSSDDDDVFKKKKDGTKTEDEISFENLKLFKENLQSIMVATKAFGMGIDKPNIRFTYHINTPSSIESYVQEAGRAGRDKKVSISTIFYNRQLFTNTDKKLTYIGKESNDSSLNRNSFYNLDRDVLLYFFYNSFRGIDKEIVMINELLNEIYAPLLTNLKTLEVFINENLADEDVVLDLPNTDNPTFERTNYIFIKNGNANIGYVKLNPLRTQHNSEIENYIRREIESTSFVTKDDCRKWLSSINANNISKEGIETIFKKKKIDESINILIPFENKYHSKIDKNSFPKRISENTLSPDYVALLLSNKTLLDIQSSSIPYNLFIEKVLNALNENLDFIEFINSFDNLHPASKDLLKKDLQLKSFYYSPRSKADTAKAVYRLNSLGIIDTYTINYQNKYYSISARKKSVSNHFRILEELFTRYTSQQRAKLLLEKVKEEQNGRSIYKTCTVALTNFVYDLVAKKRLQAIDDMIDLCEMSQSEIETLTGEKIELPKNPTIQNQVIKEEIYYYFNAKYSRKDNEAIENGISVPASLPDDFNKLNFEELVWKYIDLTDTDETGEFRTNVKHLRGSSQKMLRAYPEVPEFMVLKSFSLFILSETTPNLLEDAKAEIVKALELQNLEGDELIDFIERFIAGVKTHYQGAEIEEAFNEILSVAVINNQLKKLLSFNNKYLENYVHN